MLLGHVSAFGKNWRFIVLGLGLPYFILFSSPIMETYLLSLPEGIANYDKSQYMPLLPTTVAVGKLGLKYWPLAMIGAPLGFVLCIETTRVYFFRQGLRLDGPWWPKP